MSRCVEIEIHELTRCPLDNNADMRLYPAYDEWLEGARPDVLLPGEAGRVGQVFMRGESLEAWNRRPTGRAAALAERSR